jgi:hypothetical protein
MAAGKTLEEKFRDLVNRERDKFAEYDRLFEDIKLDLEAHRHMVRTVNDHERLLEDISLRINAIETRLATNREQREKWFELLNNLTTDVLRNRKAIRDMQDLLADKHKRPEKRVGDVKTA